MAKIRRISETYFIEDQSMIHRTRSGERVYVESMEDEHIFNTIKLLCQPLKKLMVNINREIYTPQSKRAKALYGEYNPEPDHSHVRDMVNKTYILLGPYVVEAAIRGLDIRAILCDAFDRDKRDAEAPPMVDPRGLELAQIMDRLLPPVLSELNPEIDPSEEF